MLARRMGMMFWYRGSWEDDGEDVLELGNAWEDHGVDVLEQGRCLGG